MELFPPENTEIERIISESNGLDQNGNDAHWYLVKWKGLPYQDATWESPSMLDDDFQVERFKRFTRVPKASELKISSRPRLEDYKKIEKSPESFQNGNQLRDYQLEGMNWLAFCWHCHRSCILADEMGLGKTAQTISALEHLAVREGIRGPFIAVVPLSTIEHWRREIERWTDLKVRCFP